jgi:hypothetical protein
MKQPRCLLVYESVMLHSDTALTERRRLAARYNPDSDAT